LDGRDRIFRAVDLAHICSLTRSRLVLTFCQRAESKKLEQMALCAMEVDEEQQSKILAGAKKEMPLNIKLMTVEEVSQYLHIHCSTVYRLLKRGQIPAFRVGSDWRSNIEAIDVWRSELETKQ
jgi:excisionase family DNA binding protein